MNIKPYHSIVIQDCREPLVTIPLEQFFIESPHPYEKLGAIYQEKSPYYLRKGVLNALLNAKTYLHQEYPEWNIQIFDAYRPVQVQQFMVDYTFNLVIKEQRLILEKLTLQQQQTIWEKVYQIWAIPSDNHATPPPHSTGAAIDITLVDNKGNSLNMGGEIDEISERSHPNYYINNNSKTGRTYHQRREILNKIMSQAGFCRHPKEWWHFSLGDQMWAWQKGESIARYGRIISS
ncbi:peptidase M15D vanX D-ala-D-ala dipeptidase [cyanobacterium endosymbiont of Epithemia turgida isolate EtSB Lake Yunoko]|nr:peptidase M15D vanX D-ala-D-ala dipeptidase [cyanobacterium endosymbiont of Epithemia turgida isolate EtSB Lake Yunoko]